MAYLISKQLNSRQKPTASLLQALINRGDHSQGIDPNRVGKQGETFTYIIIKELTSQRFHFAM